MDKICIDNNMILSAVWFQQARVKFFKDNKMCSLRKIYKCVLQQIANHDFIVNNVYDHRKSRQTKI